MAPIGLAVNLHDEGLRPEAVDTVEIRMSEANWKLVGKPYDAGLDSVVHAQFSAAYSFARALTDGRVGPRSYERPAITQPAIASLAQRTRVVSDPTIDRDAMEPVTVALSLRDGRKLTRSGTTIGGMTERDILDKLRGCLEFGGYPILGSRAAARARVRFRFGARRRRYAGRRLPAGDPTVEPSGSLNCRARGGLQADRVDEADCVLDSGQPRR